MRKLFISFLLICIQCSILIAFPNTYAAGQNAFKNVKNYGAVGNGLHKDTKAIQKVIDECANVGGGTVYLPPGKYLCGSLFLDDNITLHLEAGAVLLGSEDVDDYPLIDNPWHAADDSRDEKIIASLINGLGVNNIAIEGRGEINGQGQSWWKSMFIDLDFKFKKIKATGDERKKLRKIADKVSNGRPHLLYLVNCQHVFVRGVFFKDSPVWTIHPLFCDHLVFDGLTIMNPKDSPNTDGLNPEACRNVAISNCFFDVGDDCITLKSGFNKAGRQMGKPCENITITNCTMIHGHGGVVIGSEMSGGVNNVTISNCVFQETNIGIRLKTRRGRGGVVENIIAGNIVMDNVDVPIKMNMLYNNETDLLSGKKYASKVTVETPMFQDMMFSNIIAKGAKVAGIFRGLEEMRIKNLDMHDLKISSQFGFEFKNIDNLHFHNIETKVESGTALVCENIVNSQIDNFKADGSFAHIPVIRLNQSRNVVFKAAPMPPKVKNYVQLAGDKIKGINLFFENYSLPHNYIHIASDVDKHSIYVNGNEMK